MEIVRIVQEEMPHISTSLMYSAIDGTIFSFLGTQMEKIPTGIS
jgi:hypothetical protein